MSLSATLAFATDLVMTSRPKATPDEICEELRKRNWDIDDEAVLAYVVQRLVGSAPPDEAQDASSAVANGQPATAGAPDAFAAVDLESLPDELGAAVREFVSRSDHLGPPPGPTSTMTSVFSEALQEMVSGLTAEIMANAEAASDRRVVLRSGCLLSTGRNGFTARWEMETDAPAVEGATVKLAFTSAQVDAEVVQLAGTSVTLFVTGAKALLAEEAVMILDASFLLDLRRRYVRRLLSGEAKLDPVAALAFIDEAPPRTVNTTTKAEGLNAEQARFVDQAVAPGVTWLWGPPGTGKTTTLAHLLHELRQRRLRTLFVSNTNAAVDTAILKFLDGRTGARPGETVRIGTPCLPGIAGLQDSPVLIDEIAAALGLEAGSHLAACRKRIDSLKRANAKRIFTLKDPMAARDRGWFGTPEMDRFELLQLLESSRIEALRDETEGELGRLVEERRSLEALVSMVRQEIVSRGDTVFATVHQTYLSTLEGQRFDVVVIDEASMVSSDLVALAAGLGSGHAVIAGDFRQLSPISLSRPSVSSGWLQTSPFEKAGVARRVTRGAFPHNLVALTTQHRMRPGIERVIGSSFYREVGLQSGDSIGRRGPRLPSAIQTELVLVDTSCLKPWMSKRNGRYSRLNLLHAQVVDVIAAQVTPHHSFGAVSPFAPQARLLESLVGSREGHAASTVHRFQGGERDVMVWDMTEGRAGGTRVNRWFEATHADEEGARLINVAMSRARDQLYVVADLDRARSGCSDRSVVRRVLDLVQNEGVTIRASEMVANACGRTTAQQAGERHPLNASLGRDEEWLIAYCAEPPRTISAEVELEIALAIQAGRSIYIRSGVPDRQSHHASLALLQRLGCHVQLVRPCRENLILTPSSVVSSNGNLISPGSTQTWLQTIDVDFAGTALRLIGRRGDANPVAGEPDPLCASGHPLLVDHGYEQDFRGRCLTCRGDVSENVRTGRSRTGSAARSLARCRSCGEEFGSTGWCSC